MGRLPVYLLLLCACSDDDTVAPCAEGAVTSLCDCGGAAAASGYCCAGALRSIACDALAACPDGEVSHACDCGGATVTAGYCCMAAPQAAACADYGGGGAVYSVDLAGSDESGDGLAAPWRTLAHACAAVNAPGAVIRLGAGVFAETVGCDLAEGVSLEGAGAAATTLEWRSSTEWSHLVELRSAAEGTLGEQHISGLRFDGVGETAWGAILVNARSRVSVHDCAFVDFHHTAVTFNGKVSDYDPTPPAAYALGNRFYNNTVSNSAEFIVGEYAAGAVQLGGQEGLDLHHNSLTQDTRPDGENGYLVKYYNDGYDRGVRLHHNTMIKKRPFDSATDWNFAVELWNPEGGIEIYDNTIRGGIDLVNARRGDYAFTVDIHDNLIGYPALQPWNTGASSGGVYLEARQDGPALIQRNRFENLGTPLQIYPDEMHDTLVSANLFAGVGTADGSGWSTLVQFGSEAASGLPVFDGFTFEHNTAWVGGGGAAQGVQLPDCGTASRVVVRNNILVGFAGAAIVANLDGGETLDDVRLENNLYFGNGSDAAVFGLAPPTNLVHAGDLVADPGFAAAGSDFHIAAGSPAAHAGAASDVAVDLDGVTYADPPSRGCYEIP